MVYPTALTSRWLPSITSFLEQRFKVSFLFQTKWLLSINLFSFPVASVEEQLQTTQTLSGVLWAFSGLGSACAAQSWEWQGDLCPQTRPRPCGVRCGEEQTWELAPMFLLEHNFSINGLLFLFTVLRISRKAAIMLDLSGWSMGEGTTHAQIIQGQHPSSQMSWESSHVIA